MAEKVQENEVFKTATPAAEATTHYLNELTNSRDLQEVIETQVSILKRFEKTNETLWRANSLCEVRYEAIHGDFRKHIATLVEAKNSLESIFKRIRMLKRVVKAKYPEAYAACEVVYTPPDDDEEERPASSPTD
ncbi:kxDL motif-containing protein 1-like [Watersipora subatra]|uniref:kxDL motif-containing protein 1-like n=1 Tax=Watersipora subatra TaxID=2589382 RepID=UPI00355B8421